MCVRTTTVACPVQLTAVTGRELNPRVAICASLRVRTRLSSNALVRPVPSTSAARSASSAAIKLVRNAAQARAFTVTGSRPPLSGSARARAS